MPRRLVMIALSVLGFVAACTSEPATVLAEPPLTTSGTVAETTSTTRPPMSEPTLILHGGPVLTMDAAGSKGTALAVTGNEITAVGDADDVLTMAGTGTIVVDLGGRALLPGFVDAHAHYFGGSGAIGLDQIGIQDHMLSEGVTTVGEAAVDAELLSSLGRLSTDGFLRPRVSLYLMHNNGCGEETAVPIPDAAPATERGERLRIAGVKIFTDGGSCNAPAVSYEHPAGGTGDLYFHEEGLTRLISRYDETGIQVLVHALGDRAVDLTLSSLATVIGESGNPLRHRIDHNAVVPPEMRDRYDESGAVATIFGAFPTCAYLGRDDRFRFVTPLEYQEWEWPWRELIDRNPETTFAWHGDFPVFVDSTPLGSLHGFVTRSQTLEDGTECLPEPDHSKHALTVDEALRLMTMGAASALVRDDEVGSLEVGKLADLVVLSADPTKIPAAELAALTVDLTILDGEAAFCTASFSSLCSNGEEAGAGSTKGSVTVSSLLLANPPSLAIDGDLETHWGSGAFAPQWIEVDFGGETSVAGVRLVTDQSPAGFTRHVVLGRAADGEVSLLAEIAGETDDGDVLEAIFDEPVTAVAIRIETTESPSWVSWAEVEVIPAE